MAVQFLQTPQNFKIPHRFPKMPKFSPFGVEFPKSESTGQGAGRDSGLWTTTGKELGTFGIF